MDGLFGSFIPFEIWNLVLEKLENEGSQSMVDFIYLFEALEDSKIPVNFGNRLRDRWQLINLSKNVEWSEILRVSPSVRALASDSNLVEELEDVKECARPVFVLDKPADVERLNYKGKGLSIIYCGDMSAVGELLMSLTSRFLGASVSLVVDCEFSVHSGKELFGILNAKLFASQWSFEALNVSFPWVKTLECNYMALDTFIYRALSNPETVKNSDLLFHHFLHSFRLNFPILDQIKFVKQVVTRDETCNFIDLSSLMLKRFKDNKIPLLNLFRVHSLENWGIPRIKEFSGHRFKFDETTMTGSPERRTISLRENLSLLREMAINETIDATPYYRLSLVPKGVKSARLANWISTQSTPIMILKSKSLESLSLKLLTFEDSPATVVQGFFLPRLQYLDLEQTEKQKVSQFRPSIDRRDSNELINRPEISHIEPVTSLMSPIIFSSWNQLTSLHVIHINMNMDHYIFDIENMKKSLPSLNLKKSFQTFFDEQQRFIVV